MKRRYAFLVTLALILLLLTPALAALPWGTRWQSCHDNCDPQSGVGNCVLVRKLPPFMIWVVRYQDNDGSASFNPRYDTILHSDYIPTPRQMRCSQVPTSR
jgi:hypothetical protein